MGLGSAFSRYLAGATSTPGYRASLPPGKVKSRSVMPPEKVVEAGLQALGHRPFVIPGFCPGEPHFG